MGTLRKLLNWMFNKKDKPKESKKEETVQKIELKKDPVMINSSAKYRRGDRVVPGAFGNTRLTIAVCKKMWRNRHGKVIHN